MRESLQYFSAAGFYVKLKEKEDELFRKVKEEKDVGAQVRVQKDLMRKGEGGSFRTKMFLATSFMREIPMENFLPTVPSNLCAVLFTIKIDPIKKCMHANYLDNPMHTKVGVEREFLYPPYSAFTVKDVTPPASISAPWEVVLEAAFDVKSDLWPETLPIAA